MRTFLFRCDAGPQIGFGHLIRCRALAEALRGQGARCVMAGPIHEYAVEGDTERFMAWLPFPEWEGPEADARWLADTARRHGVKVLILDDYRVDETYQLVIRNAGLHWLQFEAVREVPIWADFVLYANPGVSERDYAPMLRRNDTRLLLGPKYAVLRPEFLPRESTAPVPDGRCVLVMFGGGDDRGAIVSIVSAIKTLPEASDVKFRIVSSRHSPKNKALSEWLSGLDDGRMSLDIAPTDVAGIMRTSFMAVTSGGTLTYELASCGVPMLIVAVSDNQMSSAIWEKLGAAFFLGALDGLKPEYIRDRFRRMLIGRAAINMGRTAARLVDGLGATRVATELINFAPRSA